MEPVLAAPEARAPPALSDHLVEEILVRIDSSTDLARASAACKTFRRLTTDPAFLRRYRSIHPPLLLGFIFKGIDADAKGFLPAEEPDVNASAARGLASAADFTFHYIPRRGRWPWIPYDARDGRVLLMRAEFYVGPELAVCDPLTREYTVLPPIPDDLLASVGIQVPDDEDSIYFNAFFDPLGGYEDAQFRVMCWIWSNSVPAAFVYSSISGSWTHGISIVPSAAQVFQLMEDHPIMCGSSDGYAYGYLYFHVVKSNRMIKLDINSMESTTISLPVEHQHRKTIFVEAGEGKIGMFSRILENESLCYSILRNENENTDEHLVETTISLPCEYEFYHFCGAANGYIFLTGLTENIVEASAFFSLEIKTLKLVKRVCFARFAIDYIIPYFGYPPFMSPRRM